MTTMGSNLRRRNLYTVAALLFIMPTFVPYVQEEQIGWFMWRDAPLLACTLATLAVVMAVLWWRTPRDG